MTNLDETRPLWEQIYEIIAGEISNGTLRAGDQVPSSQKIVETYGVATATAQKALSALKRDGLVRGVNGVGTFVN